MTRRIETRLYAFFPRLVGEVATATSWIRRVERCHHGAGSAFGILIKPGMAKASATSPMHIVGQTSFPAVDGKCYIARTPYAKATSTRPRMNNHTSTPLNS